MWLRMVVVCLGGLAVGGVPVDGQGGSATWETKMLAGRAPVRGGGGDAEFLVVGGD